MAKQPTTIPTKAPAKAEAPKATLVESKPVELQIWPGTKHAKPGVEYRLPSGATIRNG